MVKRPGCLGASSIIHSVRTCHVRACRLSEDLEVTAERCNVGLQAVDVGIRLDDQTHRLVVVDRVSIETDVKILSLDSTVGEDCGGDNRKPESRHVHARLIQCSHAVRARATSKSHLRA